MSTSKAVKVADKRIPKAAQEVIMSVVEELKLLRSQTNQKFKQLSEFLRATRYNLGIRDEELWEVRDDASAFYKSELQVEPAVVDAEYVDTSGKPIVETPVVDQTAHCAEGDVTGN